MRLSWAEATDKVLKENTAQAVHQQLEEIENQKQKYTHRWVWELFQNALDATPAGQFTSIRIERNSDSIAFSHNGAPFRQEEILHLIFHGSTKRESDGVIGRYGTGFLTTHVVSRKVRISGVLDTGDKFDFVLDRTGTTPFELSEAMARSVNDLERSSGFGNSAESSTRFEYQIDPETSELVDSALEELKLISPYVLAFNPSIGQIHLQDGSQSIELKVIKKTPIALINNAYLIHVGTGNGGIRSKCCVVEGENLSIAVPLDEDGEETIVASPAQLPRLFVAFPLFGTERIPLPFLLNCNGKPTEKRDGLFLNAEDTPDNQANKTIVESAWNLFSAVLREAANLGWGRLYELAKVCKAGDIEWLDGQWFNSLLVSELTKNILSAALVKTSHCPILAAEHAIFPLADSQQSGPKFFDLARHLYGAESVPDAAVVSPWNFVLTGWLDLEPVLTSSLHIVRIGDVAKHVEGLGTLANLSKALDHDPETTLEAAGWLNGFLQVILASEDQAVLDHHKLLPDQNGLFQMRSHLRRDEGIDAELKAIGRKLGQDIRTQLLDERVDTTIQGLLSPFASNDVSSLLLGQLIAKAKTEYGSATYRESNATFFAWLAKSKNLEALRSFPIISCDVDQKGFERPTNSREQLLGPPEAWIESARPFADLFPASSIMASLYTQTVDASNWAWLAAQRMCFLDPVAREVRDIGGDDIAALIDTPFSNEQEELEHRVSDVEVVDIFRLRTKDKGIIDTVRQSRTKAVTFLRFIVEHVLPSTRGFLSFRKVPCKCGKAHSIHTAIWLSELRHRQWVYERRGHQGAATALNLTPIWKETASLMTAITDADVILFLRRLGVTASEIQRGASAVSESESLNVEKAMIALLAATGNDAQRLERLADITTNDPAFLEEYERRLAQRERVRLNQQVGASMEVLFKSMFEAPEMSNLGLRISRTGWGSDFCIEHDLIENSEEFALELTSPQGKGFLVELKSTFADYVSMSETQGSEAASHTDSFALCVIPLVSNDVDFEWLRKNARFVPDVGQLLSDKVSEVKTVRALETQTGIFTSGLDVVIQGTQVLYRVKEPIWTAGLNFSQFLDFLLSFFNMHSSTQAV